MSIEGSGSKGRIAAAAGVVAAVMAAASFAWACTSDVEQLNPPQPSSARPGQTVTVTGVDWNPGHVRVYLATSGEPRVLGTAPVGDDGSFTLQATIPTGLSAGSYQMETTLIARDGREYVSKWGRQTFRVLAPVAFQPESQPNATPPVQQPVEAAQPSPAQAPAPAPIQAPVNQPAAVSQPAAVGGTPTPAVAETPAAVVAAEPAPAPEELVGPPASTAPVGEDTWTREPAGRGTTDSGLSDSADRSEGTGLLVGAGFLAVGSVALFAGFTVAVARRRRALARTGF